MNSYHAGPRDVCNQLRPCHQGDGTLLLTFVISPFCRRKRNLTEAMRCAGPERKRLNSTLVFVTLSVDRTIQPRTKEWFMDNKQGREGTGAAGTSGTIGCLERRWDHKNLAPQINQSLHRTWLCSVHAYVLLWLMVRLWGLKPSHGVVKVMNSDMANTWKETL
jgi:hypothetical protein